MYEKLKKNQKISPVDLIGGVGLRFEQNLISSLWFHLQQK